MSSSSSSSDPLEPREELREIAASLRAYLEWHVDCGSSGIPRLPRAARAAAAAAAAATTTPATPPPVIIATPPSKAMPSSLLRDPNPPSSLPVSFPPITMPPETVTAPSPSSRTRQMSSQPPPPPPSVVVPRPLPVLTADVASCKQCSLHAARTNTVFSRGNPEAKLCFVGEAPGADEDAQGLPFVGKAGQLLDKMIQAMGLDPAKDVYVCNIIKCRPPGNRRPEPIEVSTCIPYLHEQLAIVDPKVIVALGNTSVAALLGTKVGITKVRGSWKLYRGKIPVMPTYHPSYLLRQGPGQSEAKREVWEDLQTVMKELGLEKPRSSG
jgi:uracil-DNA glycosylase family 4